MAASFSTASNNPFPLCLIDVSFDLDDALTMPDYVIQPNVSSNTLVADMPTIPTKDGDVCSVCMEGFQSDGGKRTPCGHVYHLDCISSWFLHNSSCPLCRSSISS